MKIFKNALYLIVLVALMYVPVLNYFGYCRAEERFLSDDELIELAVQDALPILYYDEYGDEIHEIIWDEKVANDFARRFIDGSAGECCSVMKNDNEVTFYQKQINKRSGMPFNTVNLWGRLFGDENYLVAMRYFGTQQNSVIHETAAPRVMFRMLGTCGKIKDYW